MRDDLPRKKPDRLTMDYRHVFRGHTGRRVLDDLMNRFGVLQPMLGPELERQEGQRQVVLHILNLVGHEVKIPKNFAEAIHTAPFDYYADDKKESA